MSNTRLYWLHALSPTHAGIGRGVDYIDLPIDRDRVTHWPVIRGSSFKGVWADHFTARHWGDKHRAIRKVEDLREEGTSLRAAFGIAGDDGTSSAGALIPSDARLVCLPVRSFRGTFAWCTSPLCLQMLERTLTLAGLPPATSDRPEGVPKAPEELPERSAHHVADGVGQTALLQDGRVYLEDLDFQGVACPTASAWAAKLAEWVFPGDQSWQQQFQKRFVVLPDSEFDFLCDTATEVHTRVKIDHGTKTVADGQLWTEECLPAETILSGIIQCDRIFGRRGNEESKFNPAGLLDEFATKPLTLQIGGKATVGRGQMRCVFTPVNGRTNAEKGEQT